MRTLTEKGKQKNEKISRLVTGSSATRKEWVEPSPPVVKKVVFTSNRVGRMKVISQPMWRRLSLPNVLNHFVAALAVRTRCSG
ncbi:MAG TPA: hypothetical protein VEL76_33145 [Gemmataceae bacterium]|nr:hypothetical protein [Gemmataceae bacterium]